MTSHSSHKPHGHSHHRRSVALFGGTFDPIHCRPHRGRAGRAEALSSRRDIFHPVVAPAAQSQTGAHAFPSPLRHGRAGLRRSSRLCSVARRSARGRRHAARLLHLSKRCAASAASIPTIICISWSARTSFWKLPTWKNYEALLDCCDFIIASRPGFRIDALRLVIPPEKLGRTPSHDPHKIALRKSTVHLLTTVASHVSSTEIRHRLERHQTIHGLVPARVEEYIRGQALYR